MTGLAMFGAAIDGLHQAGGIAVVSLRQSGDRSTGEQVTQGHQQAVRQALLAAPPGVLAASLHDSDDDLAAYALLADDGSVVVNEGGYSGNDEVFEVALWELDPEQAPETAEVADVALWIADMIGLGDEGGAGEPPRLLVGIEAGDRPQDAAVGYLKPLDDAFADSAP